MKQEIEKRVEQRRNFRGMKKYEPLLKAVCAIDDFYYLKEAEWEGCLGVACVISMIEGVVPNMFSLSKHLDIPYYNINLQKAFERLKINGIFSDHKGIANDPFLNGNGEDSKYRTAAERERSAWCHIAGIAGGLTGLGEDVEK